MSATSSSAPGTDGSTPPADLEQLLATARAWMAQDPDDRTRAELDSLLARVDASEPPAVAELKDRFGSRLAFGTAGLRGELGAGPNRMNRVLVAQAAAGLAGYVLEHDDRPSVVIGFDARTNSDVFARDTAELMAGAGVRAILLATTTPTPVLAFAVRHLDVTAGVMVTASHNPPRDNGYKVYLGREHAGSQIVAPADSEIQSAILAVAARDIRQLPRSSEFETADVLDAYVSATAALARSVPSRPRVVYTAMHGVGWATTRRVLAEAGFDEPITVDAQLDPDPAFPTVAFPNPEEPGAMDLALERARESSADIVIAHDPDADRLAVAVPCPEGWRALSGNETGILLGWRAAERAAAAGRTGALAASLVSSPALGRIASAHGLDFVETLTGFKWISRVPDLLFGYEEALGYLVDPDKVRDKDGISAALDMLALHAELAAEGRTVLDRLEEAATRFGAFASAQVSVRVTDLSEIARTTTRLRESAPAHIGGIAVESVDDFLDGVGDFAPSDILRYRLEGGSRVIVRPSGTEPKLKVYIDAASESGDGAERLRDARAIVDRLDSGVRELLDAR